MSEEPDSCELSRESIDEIISRRWFEYPPIRNAIVAGALTIVLFFLSLMVSVPYSIAIPGYVLGVVIGGYYWFREGMEELVEEHRVNISILMAFATGASAALGLWEEAAFLAFLYGAAEGIEEYANAKTRGSIRKLLDLVPKEATLLANGQNSKVLATNLKVDDIFLVRPGESIPTDGVVVRGSSTVDESTVTGESVPVTKKEGMRIFAATMNKEGALEVRVTAQFSECSMTKTIHMVEKAQEQKGKAQQFIERFGNIYSPAILGIALLLIILPVVLDLPINDWATRAVVFIVAAAPCALVMSTPVSIATAIGKAGRRGVLIKGGIHIENLGKVKVVAFDKTGTLTKGRLIVTDNIGLNGHSPEEVLHMAHCVEHCSEHPIACAINERGATCPILDHAESTEFQDIIGLGASARLEDNTVYVGKPELFENQGLNVTLIEAIPKLRSEGKTVVLVGTTAMIYGLIALKDQVRPEARKVVDELRFLGIHTVMLTGDNDITARAVTKDLGIDEVHAGLAPMDKIAQVKVLKVKYGEVAMIGDGINDAPALAEATVGIAMGVMGTDAAIEAADVALMADDLSKVPYALRIGRRSNHLGRQNIAFALCVLAVMIPSALVGILSVALAVVLHESSELIAVGNGLRVGKMGDGGRIIE